MKGRRRSSPEPTGADGAFKRNFVLLCCELSAAIKGRLRGRQWGPEPSGDLISDVARLFSDPKPSSPIEGMDDLRRALKAAATGPVTDLPSKALHPEDQDTLEMQGRVTGTVLALARFAALHVEHEHLAPLRALRAALCDLTEAKESPLLKLVSTKARPTVNSARWPQPFRTLKIIVAALIRLHMIEGKKRRAAAKAVERKMDVTGVSKALLAGPLRVTTEKRLPDIARWSEEDDVALALTDDFIGSMRAAREGHEGIDDFTVRLLRDWVREAAGRGVIRKQEEKPRHASK